MQVANKQFILLGPQGSGKGTQAKLVAARLGVPHVSTGDMFREQVGRSSELGLRVKALLEQGSLVPDEVTNAMIAERLAQPDAAGGFILDGYPRNLAQALYLFQLKPQTQVLYLSLSDDEAVRRIAGRRMSHSTGAIYHLEFNPPPVNLPAGDLVQRPDDTEAAVRERLATYHRRTEPLLQFYRSRGLLSTVDGSPPIAQVTESIRQLTSQ